MAYIPGYIAKLRLNGAVFAFQSADAETQIDNLRTTNSEGYGGPTNTAGVHTSINGNGSITMNVSMASFDPANNPFLAPFLIAAGAFVSMVLYANGVGGLNYTVPSFHILRTSHRMDVTNMQPFSFSGEGNGNWSNPLA